MTKKSTQTKYHSYNKVDLQNISNQLCDNIDSILEYFGVEYRNTSKMIISSCPIHGGDNMTAFNFYPFGESYRGNWKCRTHGCEETFKSSAIGMIRGILSHKEKQWTKPGDDTVSFADTLNFVSDFFQKNNIQSIPKAKNNDKNNFNNLIKIISKPPQIDQTVGVPRNLVKKLLQIPAKYYIDRGYSKEILEKYDIGLCLNRGKEMYGRVVAPVYNNDHTLMIGCTGRSIFSQCENCKYYHDQSSPCPKNNQWKYSKWKHSFNFKSQLCLYNYWFAKEHIKQSNTAILVESPGNVWRLEENGIHNSVAMFGSNLSDGHLYLLDQINTMTLIILTDNDSAGEQAKKNIINKCQKTHKIFCPKINKNDIGEMSDSEIQHYIKDYIGKIK